MLPSSKATSQTTSKGTLLLDDIASPIGRISIAAREGRLCALEFGRARLEQQLAPRYDGAPRPALATRSASARGSAPIWPATWPRSTIFRSRRPGPCSSGACGAPSVEFPPVAP